MIDKVDRPEAPPPYRINQAKETKEDRHQQENPREQMEREYQKRIEGKEWQKFGKRTTVIKPLCVARSEVSRCLFRGVLLHSGIGTLQVDVLWRDGRKMWGALMLVTRLEDFIRLRKLTPGEAVPEELWARGTTVEFGIPETISEAGALTGRDLHRRTSPEELVAQKPTLLERAGIIDASTRRTHWGLVLLYAFLTGLAVIGALLIVM